MDSFFTTFFPERAIRAAWYKRTAALKAQRLQVHNDLLFEVVSKVILDARSDIHSALTSAIASAASPRDFHIPLWTYYTAHYDRPRPKTVADEQMDIRVRKYGYDWVVGIPRNGRIDPERVPLENEYDDVGEPGWESNWSWNPYPHSVHDIVRSTDFRHRLALMFGDDRYRVSYVTVSQEILDGPPKVVVDEVELRLHYHPHGLNDHSRKPILDAKLKYADYTPAYTRGSLPAYVWSGVPSAWDTPETPAAQNPPSSPPPLARRTNGGGLSAEEFAEVSRILTFDEAPSSIHEYSGSDAVERAAKDTVAEIAAETFCTNNEPYLYRWENGEVKAYPLPPCHCEYHRPEAE